MPFIKVKLIDGVFNHAQKQQIVARLVAAMDSLDGKKPRSATWVVIEEVKPGELDNGADSLNAEPLNSEPANADPLNAHTLNAHTLNPVNLSPATSNPVPLGPVGVRAQSMALAALTA